MTGVACGQDRKAGHQRGQKKQILVITGVCTRKNVEKMYKIQKRVPQCKMNAPREAEMALKLMKGGGPIGEFLYEVGEMERGSQMGKLMVGEMEGS